MVNDAEGPVPQADGAEESLPILVGHTICLITTDAEGRINIKLDIPQGNHQINLVGDISAFCWLTGQLFEFLGMIQTASCRAILEKRALIAKEDN